MDTVGWYIATMHNLLGHAKAAAALGVPAGDAGQCVICRYERHPDEVNRQAVITALTARQEPPP